MLFASTSHQLFVHFGDDLLFDLMLPKDFPLGLGIPSSDFHFRVFCSFYWMSAFMYCAYLVRHSTDLDDVLVMDIQDHNNYLKLS